MEAGVADPLEGREANGDGGGHQHKQRMNQQDQAAKNHFLLLHLAAKQLGGASHH